MLSREEAGRSGFPAFGRYEALFRIASGGMAEIFAARIRGEAGFEKLVAVKRMLPHLASDETFVAMFLDEARLAAHISSPHVVQTLDLGRASDGSLYIVMELVVGVTLSQMLRNASKMKSPVPVDAAVEILAQGAQGLHDAHIAHTPAGEPLHLVHRDVSPQNILVGIDGRARLTDFGVARAIQRSTKTNPGDLKGKFAYFAPEQVESSEIDHRADIFALGIVAWETLTGKRLFMADNPLATMDRIKSMRIPLVTELRPDVPPAVAEVIARATERDISKRVQTAGELSVQLRTAARRSMDLPDARNLGHVVRQVGGDALTRMQRRIKFALSSRGQLDEEAMTQYALDGVESLPPDAAGSQSGVHRSDRVSRQSLEAVHDGGEGDATVFDVLEAKPTGATPSRSPAARSIPPRPSAPIPPPPPRTPTPPPPAQEASVPSFAGPPSAASQSVPSATWVQPARAASRSVGMWIVAATVALTVIVAAVFIAIAMRRNEAQPVARPLPMPSVPATPTQPPTPTVAAPSTLQPSAPALAEDPTTPTGTTSVDAPATPAALPREPARPGARPTTNVTATLNELSERAGQAAAQPAPTPTPPAQPAVAERPAEPAAATARPSEPPATPTTRPTEEGRRPPQAAAPTPPTPTSPPANPAPRGGLLGVDAFDRGLGGSTPR